MIRYNISNNHKHLILPSKQTLPTHLKSPKSPKSDTLRLNLPPARPPTFLFPSLLVQFLHVDVVHRLQGGVHVEQVGHEGDVQLGVAADNVIRGHKHSTAHLVGLLQHVLCSLSQIPFLCEEKSVWYRIIGIYLRDGLLIEFPLYLGY